MHKLSKVSLLLAGISLLSLSMIRYLLGEWVAFCWVALFLTIFFIGVAAVLDRVLLRQFLGMKTTKQGLSMGSLIFVVIVGLVVVNYFGMNYYKTFDFSLAQTNTLSTQSTQVLDGLKEDVQVLFFYKKGVEGNEENRRTFKELVKKYQDYSNKIRLDFVEVNERPDLAKEFGVDKGSGVVFVSYQGRKNRIEKIDEQELTAALIKVSKTVVQKVYIVSGHGELNPEDAREGTGLNAFKLLLENNQFEVKDLNFITSAKGVPVDAAAVLILGPKQKYQDFEIQYLRDYLRGGGSLLLALEVGHEHGLDPILTDLGVKQSFNVVVNVVQTMLGQGIKQGPTMGTVYSPESPATKLFKRGEVTLFRYPSSLVVQKIPALAQTTMISTDQNAVAFSDLTLQKEVGKGPFDLAVQVLGKFGGDKEGMAVVVSDSEFVSNQLLYQNSNRDFALNLMSSLVRDNNAVTITPKEPMITDLQLTETKATLFLFGFILPLPLVFLAISLRLWMRRRHA